MEITGHQVDGYEYAEAATVTIADLKAGDFVVSIPTQMGIRGYRVNSGIREITDSRFGTWKMGPPRRKCPVESRAMRFLSDLPRVDYPSDCTVIVRKRLPL
jgi:hypothetical protein